MNCPRKRQTKNELLTTSSNYYNFTLVANQLLKGTCFIIRNGLGRWFWCWLVDGGGVGFLCAFVQSSGMEVFGFLLDQGIQPSSSKHLSRQTDTLPVVSLGWCTTPDDRDQRKYRGQHQSAKLNVIQLLYT